MNRTFFSEHLSFLLLLAFILLLLDYYLFSTYKQTFRRKKWVNSALFNRIYWSFTILLLALAVVSVLFPIPIFWRRLAIFGYLLVNVSKLCSLPLLLLDRLIKNLTKIQKIKAITVEKYPKISRSAFLHKAALLSASVPLAATGYGILKGAYDYQIKNVTLTLPNLPKSLKGLRIAQLSDIHAGSFFYDRGVQAGIDLLVAQKPDLIFFTGDLVNNETSEMRHYVPMFSKIKAPLGVYSSLGNHDYGDYKIWQTPTAKAKNFADMLQMHKTLGWDLLMNENRLLHFGQDQLAIIGIENWGMGRFPKYGRLDLAIKGTEQAAIKLLLSHDPSHWRAEVLRKYQDIDVSFAGHTHGFQFGLRLPHFQWSPAQYLYPEWAGLYQDGASQLYVNVGYGFLAFSGRIGMPPELTIFTLAN